MAKKQYRALKDALKIDVGDCSHKEQVLALVRNAQEVQGGKRRIGFLEFTLRQIPFMGKELWMTQGFAAFAVFGILYLAMDRNLEYLSIRHIPMLLGILSIVLVMTSVPLLLRPYRYQMHEIEMASLISLPKLLVAELMLLAVEYLVLFGMCAGVSVSMEGVSAADVALYFFLPLFTAGTGCAQIIRRTDGWEDISKRVGVCEGFCACLAVFLFALYTVKPSVYGDVKVWWAGVCCIFPVFLVSLRMWINASAEISEKDILCVD